MDLVKEQELEIDQKRRISPGVLGGVPRGEQQEEPWTSQIKCLYCICGTVFVL